MARQIVVVALVFLATVGLAFGADAPSSSPTATATATAATPSKPGLPTFSGVPSAGPVAADNNEVGTVGGADSSTAPSPGGAVDAVAAGPVGGPVSESTFGSIDGGNAEGLKASAATVGQISAGAGVAAAITASFFF